MVRVTSKGPLPQVWLNGELCRIEDARISVLDRGFLFGDGIYEIIPAYNGAPLGLERHLRRLANGLAAISLTDPLGDAAAWQDLVTTIIDANGGGDIYVYIQVTRGAAVNRDHAFPAATPPTVFAMCAPMPAIAPALIEDGVAVILRTDTRWARCDIKSTSLLANVLLRQDAVETGAAETLLHKNGFVTEGSASSVFVVTDGEIDTPPNGPEILPGTTRDLIIELAAAAGVTIKTRPVDLNRLRRADEVWLCSSLREVLPVVSIDGTAVADGVPGPVFRKIHGLYQEYKRRMPGQAA